MPLQLTDRVVISSTYLFSTYVYRKHISDEKLFITDIMINYSAQMCSCNRDQLNLSVCACLYNYLVITCLRNSREVDKRLSNSAINSSAIIQF